MPVENLIQYRSSESGLPEGTTHVKDVNNLRDKYVGTWTGTYNGRLYVFIIEKVTYESVGILWDKLYLYYKITQNGEIIEDTTSLMPNYQNNTGGLIQQVPDFMLATGDLLMNRTYTFNYIGREADCGQSDTIYISVGWDNNPNKMKLYLFPSGEILYEAQDCTEAATYILPLEQTAFYRQ